MLATADREPFVNRLHAAKRKHLAEMVQSGSIPLRKGTTCLACFYYSLYYSLLSLSLLYYSLNLRSTSVSYLCRLAVLCSIHAAYCSGACNSGSQERESDQKSAQVRPSW
jgi:hypothetical protein